MKDLTDDELRQMAGLPPATMAQRVEGKIKGTSRDVKEMSDAELQAVVPASEPAQDPAEFSAETMARNFPDSLAQYGSDVWQGLTNPIDTITGLGQAAAGAVQKYHPDALSQQYVPQAEAIGEHYSGRYGGLDEMKQTLMNDPVGVASDAAGLFGGVGLLPKLGAVGRMGSMLDPITAVGTGVGKLPPIMYEKAAKIHSRFDTPALVQTALDQGIMPTEGGLAKAQGKVDKLHNQVVTMIDEAGKNNSTIKADDMLTPLKEMRKQIDVSVSPTREADLAAIDNIITGFENSVEATGKTNVPIAEAQALKKQLQSHINWRRSAQTADPMTMQADKTMAQGVRESIEQVLPEAKGLNLRQKDLIDLMEGLEVPASRIGRRNPISLETGMTTAAGTLAGEAAGAPMLGTAAGFGLSVLMKPTVQARLAIEMNRIKKLPIPEPEKRAMAIAAIRGEIASQEEE